MSQFIKKINDYIKITGNKPVHDDELYNSFIENVNAERKSKIEKENNQLFVGGSLSQNQQKVNNAKNNSQLNTQLTYHDNKIDDDFKLKSLKYKEVISQRGSQFSLLNNNSFNLSRRNSNNIQRDSQFNCLNSQLNNQPNNSQINILQSQYPNLPVSKSQQNNINSQFGNQNYENSQKPNLERVQFNELLSQHSTSQLLLDNIKNEYEVQLNEIKKSNQSSLNELKEQIEEKDKIIIDKENKLNQKIEEIKGCREEIKECKRKIEKMRGNLNIQVRIRPLIKNEIQEAVEPFIIKESTITFTKKHKKFDNETREKILNQKVDEVFNEETSNQGLYDNLSEKINMAAEGTNLSLVVQGHTGSGKTHTISGDANEQGLIHHCIESLNKISDNIELKFSAIEIQNDQAQQFNFEDSKFTRMKDNKLFCSVKINEYIQEDILSKIIKSRMVSETGQNCRSSRSHLIIKLNIKNKDRNCESTINFVDLAGNERITWQSDKKTDEETKQINKSLSSLKNCIVNQFKKVYNQNVSIPFNDNILTKFLRDSIDFKNGQRDTYTVIICNLSQLQAHSNFILNTLEFTKDVTNF